MSIHRFITAHLNEIRYSSFTAHSLELELKDTVSLTEAIVFFADLINYVTPRHVHADISNPRHIRLDLQS